jgi:hypothetical protein
LGTVTTEYQAAMAEMLGHVFPASAVQSEWRAIRNVRGVYSPRIDIAVGPFSTTQGVRFIEEYDLMVEKYRSLIDRLIEFHVGNFREFQNRRLEEYAEHRFPSVQSIGYFNKNARCFIAIEIENNVSRKHLLGGALNASALSRIGILVPWTEEKVRASVKLLQYWDFLSYVEKNSYRADNLLILTKSQLSKALS